MNSLIQRLFIASTCLIGLASCGGGNDLASGSSAGVTSASAVASTNATPTLAAMDKIGQSLITPLSLQQYQTLFPNAMAGYTYDSLIKAWNTYEVTAGSYSPTVQAYLFTAFLANAAHETVDFKAATEYGNYNPGQSNNWQTNGLGIFSGSYSGCQAPYGGTGSICYYGRGALQLSHDYNYKVYASVTGNNTLASPDDIVGSGPNYANNLLFDSGVWFFSANSQALTPGSPRPDAAFLVSDTSTYMTSDPVGAAIYTINGAIECRQPAGSYAANEAQDRIRRFKLYLPTIVAGIPGAAQISGYGAAASDPIGVAGCTGTSTAKPISINIINNSTTTYLAFGIGDPAYYFGALSGNGLAPGANIIWGNAAASAPSNPSVSFDSLFPSGTNSITVPLKVCSQGTKDGPIVFTCTPVICNSSQTLTLGNNYAFNVNPDTGTCASRPII